VNTYSWHSNTRAPQVYKLYVSDGKSNGFNAEPKRVTDPESCGWKLLAKVDTRQKEEQAGGQCGVSISDFSGNIGQYRYLLFDISRTEDRDPLATHSTARLMSLTRTRPRSLSQPRSQSRSPKVSMPRAGSTSSQ
jgi:hypothetical protein